MSVRRYAPQHYRGTPTFSDANWRQMAVRLSDEDAEAVGLIARYRGKAVGAVLREMIRDQICVERDWGDIPERDWLQAGLKK
jgi:hypothetical protein